jgi:hypothetical protein
MANPDTSFERAAVSLLGLTTLVDSLQDPVDGVPLFGSAALLRRSKAVFEPILDDDVAIVGS